MVIRILPWMLSLFVLAGMVYLQFHYSNIFDGARNLVFDSYIKAKPRDQDALPVVVVHIDEQSLDEYGSWPWRQQTLVTLLEGLLERKAGIVALALIADADADADGDGVARFEDARSAGVSPDRWPDANGFEQSPLALSLASMATVIGIALTDKGSGKDIAEAKANIVTVGKTLPRLDYIFSNALALPPGLEAAASGIGALNVFPDVDGRIRRYPMVFQARSQLYPSFGAEAVRVAAGASSYVLKLEPGADDPSIAGSFLLRFGAEVVTGAGVALFLIVISIRNRGFWPVAFGVVLLSLLFYSGFYLFDRYGLLFDPLSPGITATAVFLTLMLSRYLVAERERRWIEAAFSRYVSPNLVSYMVEHPGEVTLSGERRECSFVFTDLAGFTPLVEQCEPEELIGLMNNYLETMISIVFRHDGTVDRIVGDAVAVLFSAPVRQPDHAARALACALEMDAFAQRFSEEMQAQGISVGTTRIGVHSGDVVVGNFGGSNYLDYRAFGDAINTAARLESVNKYLGTRLCISEATLSQCDCKNVRPVGDLLLKGKSQAIKTYTLLSEQESVGPFREHYLSAFEMMGKGDERRAVTAFEFFLSKYPGDPLAGFHLDRLRAGDRGSTIAFDKS